MAETAVSKIIFELVTPTLLAVSEEVDMVVVPGVEGDFGVLRGHTPLLTTIRPGVVDIYVSEEVVKSCLLYTSPSPRALSTCRMPSCG